MISPSFAVPSSDYRRVHESIDKLVDFTAFDRSATNLNGAVAQAYDLTLAEAAHFERRNPGGAFALPYVVVFTDGRDTTGHGGSVPPGRVLAVALRSDDFRHEDLLSLVGGMEYAGNIIELTDASELNRDFARVAYALSAKIEGAIYRFSYCSASRTSSHAFDVEVAGVSTTSDVLQFEASLRFLSCSAATIAEQCEGRTCGGYGCGACDDRESVCSGMACVSWCGAVGLCEKASMQNPLGFAQECSPDNCSDPKAPCTNN